VGRRSDGRRGVSRERSSAEARPRLAPANRTPNRTHPRWLLADAGRSFVAVKADSGPGSVRRPRLLECSAAWGGSSAGRASAWHADPSERCARRPSERHPGERNRHSLSLSCLSSVGSSSTHIAACESRTLSCTFVVAFGWVIPAFAMRAMARGVQRIAGQRSDRSVQRPNVIKETMGPPRRAFMTFARGWVSRGCPASDRSVGKATA
jgi:hypothetical protein